MLLTAAGCMSQKHCHLPDGTELRTIKDTGLFAPSMTILATRAQCGSNYVVTHVFSGPGFIPAVATGGGIAAAGALRRPDKVSVTASPSASAAANPSSVANATATAPPRMHMGRGD
jgi:hypothetical protein